MADTSHALIATTGPNFAEALAAPPLSNLRHIGGEMFAWTDRDATQGPELPHGAVLRHLSSRLGSRARSVLIAGPHADELVDAAVQSGAEVTWLLRALPDAKRAAETHPAVTVLCGAFAKLDRAAQFDLVIATDGVNRLNSAEGEQLTVAELLHRLADAVRPDGVLLLAHENYFGLHHTVRLHPGTPRGDGSAWYPLDEHDVQRPASAGQLAERLAEAGLSVDVTYAAFPQPSAPTVLVGERLVGDVASPLRPWLATALTQAFSAAFRDRPVLSDPCRLIARAVRAGAEDTVAAGWLVVARASAPDTVPADRGHDLLVGDATGTFTYAVSPDGADVRTTVLEQPEQPETRGGFRRLGSPVAPGTDSGYVLRERLLHLCASADLRQLRVELGQFESWLREQAVDGLLHGPVALVDVAEVYVTSSGPRLHAARWEPIEPIPVETVLTRATWRFAVQLITSGHPHPWPITSSAVDVVAVLLGMVGHGVSDRDVRAAVELQVALEAVEHGLTPSAQHDRLHQLLAVGPGTASVDVPGYRELTEALWRQRYQAIHLLAMMEWTEQIISSRDTALSKLDWEVQFHRRSWAGRFLMIARAGYRVITRDSRKFLGNRRQARAAAAAAAAQRTSLR